MVKFYPHDGRDPILVSCIDDIRNYMGEFLVGYGPIEIEGNRVLTNLHGQYICIGTISDD